MSDQPHVSIIMCNFNCAAYLPASLKTALDQQVVSVEVIVVDDQSQDESRAIVEAVAASDPRVRLIVTPHNMGPAGARNLGINAARGSWLAVQDSDDLMHPERLAKLIAAAEEDGADIVADDLLIFQDDRRGPASRLLIGSLGEKQQHVSLVRYIDSNRLYGKGPSLGYLKPVFRASLFSNYRFRYTESLRIAEDFDLVLRMLSSGFRFLLVPELLYFYRKRSTSISHRLTAETVADMLLADQHFRSEFRDLPLPAIAALNRRVVSVRNALAYDELISSLKERKVKRFTTTVMANPSAALLLLLPVKVRLRRLIAPFGPKAAADVPQDGCNLTFVSRPYNSDHSDRRLIHAMHIVEEFAHSGFRCHYVMPPSFAFASGPLLKLSPEMKVFDTVAVHKALRWGDWLASLEWRHWLRGAARLARSGVLQRAHRRKDADSNAYRNMTAPLTREDMLFLATHGQGKADVTFFHNAFATPAGPYMLRPDTRSIVLMSDIVFYERQDSRGGSMGGGETSPILAAEMQLLGRAERVIATNATEARFVSGSLGENRVIIAPLPMEVADTPHPGSSGRVLFIGDSSASDVDALQRILDEVWPRVCARNSKAVLDIVGHAGRYVRAHGSGIRIHGAAGDLGAFFKEADVVLLTFRAGSNLKIKLLEALSYGKAIVTSSAVIEDMESLSCGTVVVQDDCVQQADAISSLLANEEARAALASRALTTAVELAGAKSAYHPLVKFARMR